MKVTFESTGDRVARREAESWCSTRGVSFGPAQAGRFSGLRFGYHEIGRWDALRQADQDQLDGVMEGDMATGPITLTFFGPANRGDGCENKPKGGFDRRNTGRDIGGHPAASLQIHGEVKT